jgi:hypothetical protein
MPIESATAAQANAAPMTQSALRFRDELFIAALLFEVRGP